MRRYIAILFILVLSSAIVLPSVVQLLDDSVSVSLVTISEEEEKQEFNWEKELPKTVLDQRPFSFVYSMDDMQKFGVSTICWKGNFFSIHFPPPESLG